MNHNIHIFDKKIEKMINEYNDEEEFVIRMLLEFMEKTKDKVESIRKFRNSKIKEIDQELEASEQTLEQLKNRREELLDLYCKKNGHRYVLISAKCGSYKCFGPEIKKRYKCKTCGAKYSSIEKGTLDFYIAELYEQEIPENLVEDTSLTKDGISFGQIEKQIETTKSYIKYLYLLKKHMCRLFGHDGMEYDDGIVICKCCGSIMTKGEYVSSKCSSLLDGVISSENKNSKLYEEFNKIALPSQVKPKTKILLPSFPSYEEFLDEQK